MAVREESVSFFSDGYRLAGTLVLSSEARRVPAVAYSHGWSGAVNERQLPLARLMAAGGIGGLVVDHRGFGDSEGPRARCVPQDQARDLSHALTYLGTRDEIDETALGLVGVSFGGAIAIAAAAVDERARATASIVGVGDGERWLRSLRPFRDWYALRARLEQDRITRAISGAGERVDFSVLMPGPDSPAMKAEYDIMRAKYPDGYPIENAWHAIGFTPERLIARIAPRAVALIACADDTVVPAEESLAMYEAAEEPRSLTVFPEGNHGGPLGPLVDRTVQTLLEFFDLHITSGEAS